MSKRGAEAQVKEAVVVADETQESEEGGYYAKGSKKAKRASKVDIEWYTREELARQVDDDRTKTTLKIMSWNIAGLRPPSRKPTLEALVKKHDPDVICIQETKIQDIHEKDHENYLVGYDAYFTSSTAKKGYSGLVTFVKSGKGDKKKAAQKSMTSFFNRSISFFVSTATKACHATIVPQSQKSFIPTYIVVWASIALTLIEFN